MIPLWRQIQKNNFTKLGPLLDFLEMVPEKRSQVLAHPTFVLNVPFRLAAKMEKNSLQDPLFKQFVPLKEELDTSFGSTEPLQDQTFRRSKKLLQKYRGRALFVTTGACAMNCRFCFRQNFPYETEEKGFQQELAVLALDASISEVILSGGDPLSLSDRELASLFQELDKIPHIRRIRFHTRFPIGIPERIDAAFLEILQNCSKQIVFILHCNHPKELDEEILANLKKIQKLGIPLLNQSVLLKGVNDEEGVLLTLSETLVNAGILPYYLHLHDPVQRTGHFDVPEERGQELVRFLQENLSGYGVPHLVREEPGKPSKTFKG
ncbi:MAG: KamA family radical SAM protein [Verrucomicrobia bacterium]|nr:KamA family radical SAM protein [Verrucomicrobiota bacterium]MBU6447081.1 KamA family radical SAM protein [Verrucomicrobiota bacterium]MDE3048207.1 KamA family radical SAM protein [Verrucomicrobiota bacterium]